MNEQRFNEFEDVSIVDENVLTESTVQEEMGRTPQKGTPWRELSIGGTFGVLLAGGGLYASGMGKGDDEDGLLAGAQASDSVQVAEAKTENVVETAGDDPVMLDDNGNPILPVSHQQAQARLDEVAQEAASQQSAPTHSHVAAAQHAEQQQAPSTTHDVRDDHIAAVQDHDVQYDMPAHADSYLDHDVMVHPVNITTMDDGMSFSEAWALARQELGAGQAFVWRGGVYGTFNQAEWHSLSRSEQHEFTNVAVREFQQMEPSDMLAAHHHSTHFVEGQVVGADDVVVIDDAIHGSDEVSVVSDDDVMIIDSTYDVQAHQPEVITLDNELDGLEDVVAMLDFDGDGTISGDEMLGTIATLVNDLPGVSGGMDVMDSLSGGYDSSATADDMPDYVSDADTLGLV